MAVDQVTQSNSLSKEEHTHATSITNSAREGNLPAPVNTPSHRPVMPVGAPLALGTVVKDAERPFHVSPTLDERHITSLAEDDESLLGYLAPAKHALSVATESLKSIDKAYQALRNDTSKTEAQKALVLEPQASKRLDHMNKTFVTAQENLHKAVEQIEGELSAPFASATSPASMELREVLRLMKPDQRMTATKKAIAHLERAAPIALASIEKAARFNFAEVAKVRKLAEASESALAAVAELRAGV